MKIYFNKKNQEISLEQLNQIVDSACLFNKDIFYILYNQKANAKSLINLLAIGICNNLFGYFLIDDKEDAMIVEQFRQLLNSL